MEENILRELASKDKPTPSPITLRRMVDKKLQQLKGAGEEDGVKI